MNILLVEDDKISLELLRRVVESDAKYEVSVATDGEEAWRLLNDSVHKFDVCVFDIFMPALSGLDVVERMRADERYRKTPVILCTAVQDRATVQRAASLAVTHYVLKPYSRALMLDKLRQIRAGLGKIDALEDSGVVCKRLGIELDMYRPMLKSLLDDITGWTAQIRAATEPGGVRTLFIRGRGIKGSCLSLGVPRIARHLNAIETALQEYLAGPSAAFPPAALAALLDELDREIELATGQTPAAV